MITDIKEIHELFHPDKLKELQSLCIKIDRLGEHSVADDVFKLYFYLEKSCSVAASLYSSLEETISLAENFDITNHELVPDSKSEMRFHKSFPKKI